MERVGIYKDLKVSYGEFTQALLRLGYRKVPKEDVCFEVDETIKQKPLSVVWESAFMFFTEGSLTDGIQLSILFILQSI